MGLLTVGTLTIICLAILAALSTWGVFTRHLDDTLGQRVGLSIAAIGCIARIAQLLTYDYAAPSGEALAVLIGVTVYAVSTALKIVCARRRVVEHRRRRGAAHGC